MRHLCRRPFLPPLLLLLLGMLLLAVTVFLALRST